MLGKYVEEDIENEVRPFVEVSSAKMEAAAGVAVTDLDWFGNTTLHHCFANNEIVMPSVCKVLDKFPEYALVKNQFGRIPLHYALDRIKVNINGVKKLIEIYPEGVRERDNDNKTPYDVALKWKHSKAILKLLLDVDPDLDRAMYFKIQYGVLAVMYNWLFLSDSEPRRNRIYSAFTTSASDNRDDRSLYLVSVDNTPDPNEPCQSSTDYTHTHPVEGSLTDLCDLSVEQISETVVYASATNSKSTLSTKNSGRMVIKDVDEQAEEMDL